MTHTDTSGAKPRPVPTPTSAPYGNGSVHTFAVAAVPTAPAFADDVPQVIAVVELEEGPRITSTLVDIAPQDVVVGLPVAAVFDHGPDVTMPRFRPRPKL
jgi:uncharacterized protein